MSRTIEEFVVEKAVEMALLREDIKRLREANKKLADENAELKRQLNSVQEPKPDYVYDEHEWEATYPIEDLDALHDGAPAYEPIMYKTLVQGPDIFAVGGLMCCDTKWFRTKQAAEEYVEELRAKDEVEE